MVPDQQQLRARGVDVGVDRGEVGGVGHRGLVDDDEIARAQAPAARRSALRGRRRGGPGWRASA